MRKILPIFHLESSIYLIKEFDNQAIFPGQSGRFNPAQIVSYCSYEVHGDPLPELTAATPQIASQGSITPFGAYLIPRNTSTSVTCTPVSQPVKSVARGRPCASKVSKTIILVTL